MYQLNNSVLPTFRECVAHPTALVGGSDKYDLHGAGKFQFYGVFDALRELVTLPNF